MFGSDNTRTGDTVTIGISSDDITRPDAPANLSADKEQSSTAVLLSWDKPNDNVGVTGYKLYRTRNAVTDIIWQGWIGSEVSPFFRDTDLPGGSYEYRLCACDLAGNSSSLSGPVVVTLP